MKRRLACSLTLAFSTASAADLAECLNRICELTTAHQAGCHAQSGSAFYLSRQDHTLDTPVYYFSGAKVYEYALKAVSRERPFLSLRRPSALTIQDPNITDLSDALVTDIELTPDKDPPWRIGDGIASKIAYLATGYKMLKSEFAEKVSSAKGSTNRTVLKEWIDKTYNDNIGTVRDTLGEMHALLDKTTLVDPVEIAEPRAGQILRDTIGAELSALPESLRFKRSRWEAARAAIQFCETQGQSDTALRTAIESTRRQFDLLATAKAPRTIQPH